jgi:LRR receptor-like serine/threonine-protein kinase FLS2
MDTNKFNGEIPMQFGLLSDLEVFHIFKNNLVGTIPGLMINLIDLRDLRLSENRFNGPLPVEFSRLYRLETLFMDNNEFAGAINSIWPPKTLEGTTYLQEQFFNWVSTS